MFICGKTYEGVCILVTMVVAKPEVSTLGFAVHAVMIYQNVY